MGAGGVHPVSDLPGFARQAAESGNARVVKRWVHSTDRNVDARSAENLTALHYAVRGGHNECTRLLLTANADPNAIDERSITPLHLAALGGHALCVKLLLDHHADPFREDVDHHTPLIIAEQSGNIDARACCSERWPRPRCKTTRPSRCEQAPAPRGSTMQCKALLVAHCRVLVSKNTRLKSF